MTKIAPTSLKTLVKRADHVVVARIVKVDMVDADGGSVADLEARTGPGAGNTIRLHVDTDPGGILKAGKTPIPTRLVVSDWPMWHRSLGDMKEREGTDVVLLLRGDDFSAVSEPEFIRDIEEAGAIRALLARSGWTRFFPWA